MTTQTAIHSSAKISDTVIASYVSDLEDAELLTRPGAGCNHLAWQLGHLISSEVQLLESIAPGKGIALPDGFNAAHSKAANGVDEADAFLSKQAYLDLYSDVRQASAAALDTATTAELDEDAPETFRAFCPTVLDMYVLIAAHPMMHAGQFAVVRRQLGKPVLM
ncbi:DinB family protein [Rhodopirellula sp.]|nr:DinB family protein [Rubripirellula sp.]MDA7904917.1 DinB family protein [Rhodopirellula sp.]MDB4477333.1 DinB family protein [Rhodopirellula sp.]MDB4621799.1 DinB family protein [Rubripirellula sp.]